MAVKEPSYDRKTFLDFSKITVDFLNEITYNTNYSPLKGQRDNFLEINIRGVTIMMKLSKSIKLKITADSCTSRNKAYLTTS